MTSLHPDHEILTIDGWKKINLISKNDLIATLKNYSIYYEQYLQKTEYVHDDIIYNISNDLIDIKCTDNTKVYTIDYTSNILEVINQKIKYRLGDAIDQDDYKFILPTTNDISYRILDTYYWLKLLGYFYVYGNKNNNKIKFNCTKILLNKIIDILNILNISYLQVNEKSIFHLIITDTQINTYLLLLFDEKNNSKYLPDWLFHLSFYQTRIFLNIIFDNNSIYTTNSLIMANNLQHLAIHAGFICIIKYIKLYKVWDLIIYNQNISNHNNIVLKDKYNGPLYNIIMPESNYMTRLNGKCSWILS